MDFTLSKQQQMVQKMYREFAENEVKPLAKKVDAEEYFPKETVEKMGKLGMMGIYFPTEVGGAGGDVLSYVMAVEELSKVCGTTGVIVSAHTSLCAAPIYENGTPEQKAKYLPKLCSGEWLGAFGLTEPGAGTDAQGQQTIAKEDGDYWVLNGSKIFITNAGFADVFIVIAVTDNVLDKRGRPTKLCSAFIVERTDPGFSVGKAEDKMGIRGSSTCDLIFEDCIVPKENLLGKEGKRYVPYLMTVAIYIAFCNLIGVFGVKPPTKDLDVTAALALMSIVLIEYSGIHARGGKGFLKSLTAPTPIMTPMNILEIAIRPTSLCMRLFGNVLGAFVIMELIKLVVPVFVPAVFSLYFDLFDGLIQTYVFVFLTSLFMKESLGDEE